MDLERLAPVAGAHRRRRGQPVRRVGRASRRSGSVSCFHAFETWPSIPPGAAASRDQADDRHERERAEQRAAGEPPGARRGGRCGGEEADRQPGGQQRDEHQQQQRAELVAGVRARGDASAVVGGQPVLGERPGDDAARRRRADAEQRDRAAQPQRHDDEPERDARSRARAARRANRTSIRQTSSSPSPGQASALTAAWPERRAAEPQQRRDARARPSARPRSSSRTARAGGRRSRRRQRAREDLRQQRPAADDHAGRARRRAGPRPAAGREPRERHRAGERRRGRRACGWPRARSPPASSDQMIESAVQRGEQRERPSSVAPPWSGGRRARGTSSDRRGAEHGADAASSTTST